MAIAARANKAALFYSGGTATTYTGSEGSGWQQNDILIAFAAPYASPCTFTAPSGWTLVQSSVASSRVSSWGIWWIRRGASAPALNWTFSGSTYFELTIVAFSGCITTGSPIDVSAKTAIRSPSGAAAPDPPSITTVTADCLALAFGGSAYNGSAAWTAPSGYSIVVNGAGATVIASKQLTGTGAENPGTFGGGATGEFDLYEATLALIPGAGTVTSSPIYPSPIRHILTR
jgi:hypothetical protein